MFTRRGVVTGALSLASLATAWPTHRAKAVAAAATATPPAGIGRIKDFFLPASTIDAALSPKGDWIAVLQSEPDGDSRRSLVTVRASSAPAKVINRIALGKSMIEQVEFATEDRLLLWVRMGFEGTKFENKIFGFIPIRRVVSTPRDGSQTTILFQGNRSVRGNFNLATVVDLLPDDPEHILMAAWDTNHDVIALYRVSILTGAAELVERGTSRTVGWQTQKGTPVLRYELNLRGTQLTIRARAAGESDWKVVRKMMTAELPDFTFVASTDTPGVLLVTARTDGEATQSLRTLDIRTMQFGAPISSRPDLDAQTGLIDERHQLLGTAYFDDRLGYDFADKAFEPHFKAINTFLGNECNVTLFDVDAGRNRFLAKVSGPREPGSFYFYDKAARRMENLGHAHPGLAPEQLASVKPQRIRTRDGAVIRAYLTVPASQKPGPLVALIHGGPAVRDNFDWDRHAQVLAAQGWWVLQPNFRGSAGFGRAFEEAGDRRWGDLMQHDVEDAVLQVVRYHGLPRDKLAIMGASYGGYAALMGAVLRPDLYRAVVAVSGVSDLLKMLEWERREDETPDKDVYNYWVRKIGDPKIDRALLEAASPRRQAARFACPVLLVHGTADTVVPVQQSRMMADALKAAKKTVDYVELPGIDHGGWGDEQEEAHLTRCVKFIGSAFA